MKIINTIGQLRIWHAMERKKGRKIGFVPTMGYLHEGHLSLVQAAKHENDSVVMSIFVNPLQFGPNEDYKTYPRDIDRDTHLAEGAGVDVVFIPEVSEMYPYYPQLTTVEVKDISERLCGASRPGHFTGVTTVVSKLFNIVQPDAAYFGQKDYQQVQVIKKMAADLNMPVKIVTVPIKRETDGLAMSSRNTYLSDGERKEALCLNEALLLGKDLYEKGEKDAEKLTEIMHHRITKEPSALIDYIEICDAETLKPIDKITRPTVIALAVKIGRTRLIDNIVIGGEE